MSDFWPCNVWRSPWEMTTLLLVLLTSLAVGVLCNSEEEQGSTELPLSTLFVHNNPDYDDLQNDTEDISINSFTSYSPSQETIADPGNFTNEEKELNGEEELSLIIILVPVALVVVVIAMVALGIVISRMCNHRTNQGKEEFMDDFSTEKVPMPMFEDDVPSVLELEMEEFDEWINKEGGGTIDSRHN